jgi:hypothetical protein
MEENEIFEIQRSQLLNEIKKVQFIADNAEQIQKNLFTQVFEENKKYFAKKTKDPSQIFRGGDFDNYIDWYYRNQTKKILPPPLNDA